MRPAVSCSQRSIRTSQTSPPCCQHPNEVADATQSLNGAVTDLRGFVAENRESVGVTVDRLTSIATALNNSRATRAGACTSRRRCSRTHKHLPGRTEFGDGILAPVNFADTVQFICSAIEAASRQGFEKSSKLCMQYLAPIIKNRQYNFPPLGVNPFPRALGETQRDHLQREPTESQPAASAAG